MHIKQIIIKGFKTYKDEIVVGPLSAKDNIFVGHNGHGKSNFFSAIMFVLSDKYSNIRQEEKQRLIHEGSSQDSRFASVEIILDNSSGRLPIDKSSVSLKRVLKGNKDELYIDNKHVTKGDVNNLLESAGFSKANPYYVVQQGRVASLANMSETQCLELLKEVAGTKVYDERKAESVKLLEETKRKRNKVQETMNMVEERGKDLEQQSEELKAFQQLEKQRRALEYILYKNHVVKAQTNIDKLQAELSETLEQVNSLKLSKNNLTDEIESEQHKLDSANFHLQQGKAALQTMEEEASRLNNQKLQLEYQINSLSEKSQNLNKEHLKLLQEIDHLKEEQKSDSAKLEELKPKYHLATQEEQKLNAKLTAKQRRKDQLFSKQATLLKFKTIGERNEFLKSELKALSELKEETQNKKSGVLQMYEKLNSKVSSIETEISQTDKQVAELKANSEEWSNKILELKKSRSEKASSLNNLRYEEDKLLAEKEQLQNKVASNFQLMQTLFPGYSSLEKLKFACSDLPGFYGLLLDLIEIPSKFQTCSDVSCKLKGFSIVVDTFETAKKVLERNEKLGGHRIHIFPLEWFRDKLVQQKEYPEGSDSIVLLKQIKTKQGFDLSGLLDQVFGKTVLVRNQDIANKYSKQYKLNCVTPDGQIVYSGGFMVKAGFHDVKKERIRAYYSLLSHKQELNQTEHKLNQLKHQKETLSAQEVQLIKELQEATTAKSEASYKFNLLKSQEQVLSQKRYEAIRKLSEVQKTAESYTKETKEIEENIKNINKDMKKQEIGELSAKEVKELEKLIAETEQFEKAFTKASSSKLELESEIRQLELKLNQLIPEKERKLKEDLQNCNMGLEARERTDLETELSELETLTHQTETQVKAIAEELKEFSLRSRELTERIKNMKEREQTISKQISELQVHSQRMELDYSSISETKENYSKKMSNLGSISSEEHDRYKNHSRQEIIKLVETNSRELSRYMHVNKRALEQYTKLTDRINSLKERISELDSSESSISELFEHLDQVKDEAIIRTFRSVAQHFSEVFNELVPQGKGRLKMAKGEGEGVDKYIGVSISVAFSRAEDVVYKMQQLSGGQKTAVAIALIIAIQKADPAPFYLFDELDAALDTQLRTSLAGLISRAAENAQFIMTTFKPELCKTASLLFEVKFLNTASVISRVDSQRALEVIQKAESNEE